MDELSHGVLYDMVSTCNRQIAILRRIRARSRLHGAAVRPSLDVDLANLERIQQLLVHLERRAAPPSAAHRLGARPPVPPLSPPPADAQPGSACGAAAAPFLPGMRPALRLASC